MESTMSIVTSVPVLPHPALQKKKKKKIRTKFQDFPPIVDRSMDIHLQWITGGPPPSRSLSTFTSPRNRRSGPGLSGAPWSGHDSY
jgi:hypothetical protein